MSTFNTDYEKWRSLKSCKINNKQTNKQTKNKNKKNKNKNKKKTKNKQTNNLNRGNYKASPPHMTVIDPIESIGSITGMCGGDSIDHYTNSIDHYTTVPVPFKFSRIIQPYWLLHRARSTQRGLINCGVHGNVSLRLLLRIFFFICNLSIVVINRCHYVNDLGSVEELNVSKCRWENSSNSPVHGLYKIDCIKSFVDIVRSYFSVGIFHLP